MHWNNFSVKTKRTPGGASECFDCWRENFSKQTRKMMKLWKTWLQLRVIKRWIRSLCIPPFLRAWPTLDTRTLRIPWAKRNGDRKVRKLRQFWDFEYFVYFHFGRILEIVDFCWYFNNYEELTMIESIGSQRRFCWFWRFFENVDFLKKSSI